MSDPNMQLGDAKTYWLDMNAQAELGILDIPVDVASRCDAACVVYLDQLATLIDDTRTLVNVKAYGDLESGQQLGNKFARSARGTPTSLDAVLLQHTEVIQSMRTFFRRYFDGVDTADRQNSESINSVDPDK